MRSVTGRTSVNATVSASSSASPACDGFSCVAFLLTLVVPLAEIFRRGGFAELFGASVGAGASIFGVSTAFASGFGVSDGAAASFFGVSVGVGSTLGASVGGD